MQSPPRSGPFSPLLLAALGLALSALVGACRSDPSSLAPDASTGPDARAEELDAGEPDAGEPDIGSSLAATRSALMSFVWRGQQFPRDVLPDIVEYQVSLPEFDDLPDLASIDRFEVHMEHEVSSIAHLFHPREPNDALVIYNQGHVLLLAIDRDDIEFFLGEGYAVLALSMPLFGQNEAPPMFPAGHNGFAQVATDDFSPIKLFLHPVVLTLNQALRDRDYRLVAMTGYSGGGWTTTLAAAIDTRIQKSYPVAGTLPLAMRSQRELGDYEQFLPALYAVADYETLYALGSSLGRRQLQILNTFDSCCFASSGREDEIRAYESRVKDLLVQLGNGELDVVFDDTHEGHFISEHALGVIAADLVLPRHPDPPPPKDEL